MTTGERIFCIFSLIVGIGGTLIFPFVIALLAYPSIGTLIIVPFLWGPIFIASIILTVTGIVLTQKAIRKNRDTKKLRITTFIGSSPALLTAISLLISLVWSMLRG